ncbi:MAG TPA: oligosaccharide flippase family protein, partial [Flavihumibacter sp.]
MRAKLLAGKFFPSLLQSDNARTKLAIRNIIGSLFVKGGSVLISLLLVPLTIKYVNATQYGIWLALSSIIAWFSFFDIGLGNGLKNKLAEALAKEDTELARSLVSTTYALLCILVLAFVAIFLVVHHFMNWSAALSLPAEMEPELRRLISLVFILFCIQFILQTIMVILTAHQQVSTASFLSFLGNLLSLVFIFILTKTTEGNLYYLGLAFSATPLVVYFFSSLFYFKTKFRLIAPSFKSINFGYSKVLMGLGVKFFIIQIAAIILYQTTNILLLKLYDAEEVTAYNVSYRYFGVITMVFSIVMSPFWVAFSDAYHKQDFEWIKKTVNKLVKT